MNKELTKIIYVGTIKKFFWYSFCLKEEKLINRN